MNRSIQKQLILEIANQLGFQRTVIASLAPLDLERQFYVEWLSKGYAAGMDYLKRNPNSRTSPATLQPDALSAIVVSASYYTEKPQSPGPQWGRVARYAVGRDYHVVLRAKLRELKAQLESALGRPLVGKAFTDDVALYEQAFAARHGLGFTGRNSLIIGPKMMGSYHFIAELMTDLDIEPDEPYHGTCGKCFRCGTQCPTDAIVDSATVDSNLCISYLTIENKDGIPEALRPQMGDWLFGCDVCQEVCPYNQRPPETAWQEFQPNSGVGHYMDLFELLKIPDQETFHKQFIHSPVRRPKRRGLLRNALIVLGNTRPEDGVKHIKNFAAHETDPMLREHADWALAQY